MAAYNIQHEMNKAKKEENVFISCNYRKYFFILRRFRYRRSHSYGSSFAAIFSSRFSHRIFVELGFVLFDKRDDLFHNDCVEIFLFYVQG